MRRILIGLFLLAGFFLLLNDPAVLQAQKGGNSGTIAKFDDKGRIVISMTVVAKKKKENIDREYLLKDDAKITIVDGGDKKTVTVKEAIEKKLIKEGSSCTFTPDGDLYIRELIVGGMTKKK